MSTLYVDIVESCGGVHHIIAGWAITRVAAVTGITPSPNATQDTGQILSQAMAALEADSRIGPRGTACPNIAVPTYLEQFIPEVVTPDLVRVRIVYKGFPKAIYEFDSALDTVQSNKNAS